MKIIKEHISEAFEKKDKDQSRRALLIDENWSMVIVSPCVKHNAEPIIMYNITKSIIIERIDSILETYLLECKNVNGDKISSLEVGDVIFSKQNSSESFKASEIIKKNYPNAKTLLELWGYWWSHILCGYKGDLYGLEEIEKGIIEISTMKISSIENEDN